MFSLICIIGAGPAGITTSIFLAKAGIPHILLDAATFPRNKVCGDGLDITSIRMLNHIDPQIIQSEINGNPHFSKSNGIRNIVASGKMHDFVFKNKKNLIPADFVFLTSKRIHFDSFLLSKINKEYTTFLPQTKVESLIRVGQQWILHCKENGMSKTISCNVVVGADGDRSVVLKYLGQNKVNREYHAAAIKQYWKGINQISEHQLLELYFPKYAPLSYFWIFPLPNGEANVGFGYAPHQRPNQRHLRQDFMQMIEKDKAIKNRFVNAIPTGDIEGWGLPLATLQRNLTGDGWLLVGDAGSLVSPNTGEGIGNAMRSGYIAAAFIERAAQKQDFSRKMFHNYQREIFKSFRDEIALSQFLHHYIPTWHNYLFQGLVQQNFFMNYYFQNSVLKWLQTAYFKKIIVNMD